MLNTTIFNVLNKVLEGNLESVDLYYDLNEKVQLTTKSKMLYADFTKKTSHIISEYDIGSIYDEDEEDLTFTIDLTREFVDRIIAYVKSHCLNDFEEFMKN